MTNNRTMIQTILRSPPVRLVIVLSALLLTASLTLAEEFQASVFTTGRQQVPAVAMDAAGRFIVVWQDSGRDGSAAGIFGRRYDAQGAPLGDDFAVNTYTTDDQMQPDVAADASGNFVVVWTSYYQDGDDGGIFGQKFDSDGMVDGAEFQVNADTSNRQIYPNVSMNDSGEFVVVWTHYTVNYFQRSDVAGQRFDSMGVVGSQFAVNSHTTNYQCFASVAVDDTGGFVVAWESTYQVNPAAGAEDVFARIYDSLGAAAGLEFQVNTYTTDTQRFPRIAQDGSGDFVVVWASDYAGFSNDDVVARRFDSSGSAKEADFIINTHTTNAQRMPGVDMDSSGRLDSVFAQKYDASAVADGDEFQANIFTLGSQTGPVVALDDSQNFVVAWTDSVQDGSLEGVFGQHFPSSRPSSDLSVAICGTDAHHAWVRFENGGANPNIIYRRCTVAGSCSAPIKLVGAATVESKPVVACDGSTVLVVWEDYRDGNADIASRRSVDGGTSFAGLQFLVRGPANETSPVLTMDNGVALLVFEDFRNGNKDLASRRSTDTGATWGTFTFLVRSPFDDSDPILGMDGNPGRT